MKYRILVADDSQTIQKVIKITLASEPFDIIECLSEDDLIDNLLEYNPHIVLLDYNLSENKSGHELCSLLLKESPSTKVIMLYGTFDNFTQKDLDDCGASNKIVKPFDGTKFINVCNSVVNEIGPLEDDSEIALPGPIDETEVSNEVDDEEEWVMNAPSLPEVSLEAPHRLDSSGPKLDVLQEGAQEWGMSVPAPVDQDVTNESSFDLPPIIEPSSDETVLPDQSDLEYPDMDFNTSSLSEDTQRDSIEEQIMDEMEAPSTNLWDADKVEDEVTLEAPDPLETPLEITFEDEEEVDEPSFRKDLPIDRSPDNSSHFDVNYDELVEQILADGILKKKVIEALKDDLSSELKRTSHEIAEKVAWEVIPDLAENLIKQELRKLSDSI